jgi:hypothetical protein
MEKIYNISNLQFENDLMIINVDNTLYEIRIKEASEKLFYASDSAKNDYKISPSGYGIHWFQIDEDLSINGLIRIAKKVPDTKI